MTSEPKAPSAPAIYLYRQVDRDDNGPNVAEYVRIKILTEEGRKYANVELTYDKHSESIRDIHARTIGPDGTIVDFAGAIYEKPILKGKGVKLLAKSFSLPAAQVGSIIEYRYRHYLAAGWVFDRQRSSHAAGRRAQVLRRFRIHGRRRGAMPSNLRVRNKDTDLFEITLPAGQSVDELPPQ